VRLPALTIRYDASAPILAVEDLVRHANYGVGRVAAVAPSGNDYILTVEFQTYGTRRMMAGLSRLVRVS
jgi:PcrA/UvrD tudor domain